MKWEDLTVYKTLQKEDLNVAKKEIECIILNNLQLNSKETYPRLNSKH